MRALEVFLVTLGGIWQGLRQDFNLLEIAALVVLWFAWKRGWRPNWAWKFAPQRPALAALTIAAGAIAVRLAIIPLQPVPIPIVTDEFSHQLLADTLLHGRLTNDAHPFWQHFESLHILATPHYVSNYFPGHALLLAAGKVVANYWTGVLLEAFVFLAALYWCLRAFLTSRWAIFGTLLAALRFAIASYWVNAYHGGFLPAIGGALFLGGCGRVWRRQSRSPSGTWAIGLGAAVMLATRPFEGAFLCLPVVGLLVWRVPFGALVKPTIVTCAMIAIAALGLGTYFRAITGSPFATAYNISQKMYGWPMTFAWSSPPKIEHRHVELAAYYDYEVGEHEKVSNPVNFAEFLTFRVQEYWRFFLGPLLTLPLFFWRRIARRHRLAVAATAGCLFAVLLEGASSPHYFAPATAAVVLLVVEGCRRLPIAGALPYALAGILALRIAAQGVGVPYTQHLNYQSWCCRVSGDLNKARISAMLDQTPGEHLVLVKAKTDPYNLLQWIYNGADIDSSRIVWARDLGAEANARLIEYFARRRVWIVDPNVEPASLTPVDSHINARR